MVDRQEVADEQEVADKREAVPVWLSTAVQPRTVPEVADRVLDSVVSGLELAAMALGERLGWYAALAAAPAGMTSVELASATSTHERYCREWLEQQAASGMLEVPEVTDQDRERFTISEAAAEAMADARSSMYLAPLVRQAVAAVRNVPAVVEAARSGGGVPWREMDTDMRESQGDVNKPQFLTWLRDWLDAMPEVASHLSASGARAADIGCGFGWSSIALAKSFPEATVDGFDIDAPTVDAARANVAAEGLEGRVRVERADVAALPTSDDGPRYDLVTAFECVHDMPDPVGVLRWARQVVKDDGAMLVADERVAERFSPPADLVERMMYGWSLTVCLPDSMSAPGSVATGTAMRPSVLASYAEAAGFSRVEELDVEHDFWRFYRLVP